ncbi:MAG: Rpn family recombination-promoting nuclease/putative transposase [Lamprobacter sp.]|uniref:Rpn family recombination-promoting nuclease/putative transposase n=1 Tax=Lamprobacter sp. TaxID=3100796 RepID=UPI002B25BE03|nr:Rpn family recombination-promoting nuclease/putative transposase [Lamprobacter sp.]MEA3643968.1 Rpn family recombination-promoting nuclease/putative transposase [Lamprobacter sp.]
MAADLLDPRNDYVFKRIFAGSPDLAAALINDLRPSAPPVVTVDILNPTIAPEELTGKTIVLDVLARDASGRRYNIEMQVRRYANWSSRALYYLSRLLGSQLSAGEGYEDVSGVVGIHILGFDLFPEEDQALWCFEPRDAHRPHVALGTALQWNILELPKAERLWRDRGLGAPEAQGSEHSLRATRAWAAFFEHWAEESIMADIQHEPVVKAMGRIIELSADE